MRSRSGQHVPPFFSLPLLDVVCNALGAIIFLMFLSYWQANHVSHRLQASLVSLGTRERELEESRRQLTELLDKLGVTQQQLAQAEQHLKQTEGELAKTEQARQQLHQAAEELRLQLRAERFLRQQLQMQLELSQARARDVESRARDAVEQLRQLQRQHDELASEFQKALAHAAGLEAKLRQAEQNQLMLSQTVTDLRLQLVRQRALAAEQQHASQIRQSEIAALQAWLNQLRKESTTATETVSQLQTQLAAMRAREKALANQLAQSQARLDALSQERDDLNQRLELQRRENQRLSELLVLAQQKIGEEQKQRAKLAAQLQQVQARFAGVDLSGKRVILLVDTSGSMGKRDPRIEDAGKWPRVCETVRHVLISMPNLQHFQLITFADQVRYPLGRPYQWHSYDQDHSPQQVHEALLKLRPEGGTNLHRGFEEAFSYHQRELGLDTIILFSDGLPTESPDLKPDEVNLPNNEREARLAPRLLERIRQWNRPLGQPPQTVRIHAVGFYYDSPNLGNFLWSLARQNQGSFVGMSEP